MDIVKKLLLFSFSVFIIVNGSCKELEKFMQVSTGAVTNAQTNTAEVRGDVIDLGEGAVQYGHCYGKKTDVTVKDLKTEHGLPLRTGVFISQLSSLEAGTKYYIKAYITDGLTPVYGKEVSFTTVAASVPVLTTIQVTTITATSAVSGGNITGDGGDPVTARGVCWSTTTGPTTAGSKTSDGSGPGMFTSNITGLVPSTIYYVRSYSANSAGTAYGNEISFTTGYYLPTVTVSSVTSVTPASAICGGSVSLAGGPSVSLRGVCWNTTVNPTVAHSKTTDGSGVGSFVSNITGLNPSTTYYVRAYAITEKDTVYSSQTNFVTLRPQMIQVISPKSGDIWNLGSTQLIRWEDGITEGVKIVLLKGNVKHSDITASGSSTESDGLFEWNVPSSLVIASDYSIKITSEIDVTNSDTSDFFTTSVNPYIAITKPNSTDNWVRGREYEIVWTDNISENVNIELYKGGVKNNEISMNSLSDQSHLWTLPSDMTAGSDYSIRITSISNANLKSESGQFMISAPISITAPAVGSQWIKGQQNEIKWVDYLSENVNIELYKAGVRNSDIVLNTLSDHSHMWTVPAGLTAASNYSIKISSITDSNIKGFSEQFSIVDGPYINVIAPAIGSTWIKDGQYEIKWTDNISENVNIELYKAGVKNSDIVLNTPSDQSHFWTVPSGLAADGGYTIKITSITNSSVTAESGSFNVSDPPFIFISAPAAGITWTDGQEYEIKWTDNLTSNVDIELYKNGIRVSDIALDTPSDQSYLWAIPVSLVTGSDYSIRITSTGNSSLFDDSGQFTIVDKPFITVSVPAAGSNWSKGKEYEIKWTDNITENVNIELFKGGVKNRDIVTNTANDLSHKWTASASLTQGNDYSIRIVSTVNSTIKGESGLFTISESVTDVDGNFYRIVTIGTQVWMAENLKTTKYNDNTAIPLVTENSAWNALAGPGYCWYNNEAATYKAIYGALYNWFVVGTGKLCPAGWHVPSDAEWTTLTDYLTNNGYGYQGSGNDIGKSLAATSGWETNETPGTVGNDQASNNSSGFTALPGGARTTVWQFGGFGADGYWWSVTENGDSSAWYRALSTLNIGFVIGSPLNKDGYSVRCLKDK